MRTLIDPWRWGATVAAFGTLVVMSAGCSSSSDAGATTQPAAIRQRQDQALADPFGYTPDAKNSDMTVSGHGQFDKEGLKRDTDFFLNP